MGLSERFHLIFSRIHSRVLFLRPERLIQKHDIRRDTLSRRRSSFILYRACPTSWRHNSCGVKISTKANGPSNKTLFFIGHLPLPRCAANPALRHLAVNSKFLHEHFGGVFRKLFRCFVKRLRHPLPCGTLFDQLRLHRRRWPSHRLPFPGCVATIACLSIQHPLNPASRYV